MIVKSIFTTFILFTGYWLLVSNKQQSQIINAQHQWQENVIKAQQYVYSNKVADNIIIGSSLSSRLTDSLLLSSKFYNLSFGGQSVYDGLDIVCSHSVYPKKIFIEVNMLKRSADKVFTNGILHPVLYPVRKLVSPLKEVYQPANYLNGIILTIGERAIDRFTNLLFNPILNKFHSSKKNASTSKVNMPDLFESLVVRQVVAFNETIDSSIFNKQMRFLYEKCTYLKNKGVDVYFFEMPLHPQLENTNQMKHIRNALVNLFPKNEYSVLPKPDYSNYSTTDGLHLNPKNALKYTETFLEQTKQILP